MSLVISGYLLIMATSVLFAFISEVFHLYPAVNNQVAQSVTTNLGYLAIPVFLSPLVEEIVFRNLLLTLFEKKFSFIVSCCMSSLIFSVCHLDWFFLPYFFNGVILCVIRKRTGSIYAPIVTHWLYNASTLLVIMSAL